MSPASPSPPPPDLPPAPPPPTPTEMPYAISPLIPMTYYLQLINSYLYIALIIGAMYFFDPSSVSHWITAGTTFIFMVLIACGSSYLVAWEKRRNQDIDELIICEKHMKYSLWCIMMCGHVPAILSFTIGWIPNVTPSITILCSFLASQAFSCFYNPTVGKTTVDYQNCVERTFCCLLILLLCPILFACISYHNKGMESYVSYIFNQLICTIFYTTSTLDYGILMDSGARRAPLKNNQIGVRYRTIKLPMISSRAFRLLSCPICYIEYCELQSSQTPRNLSCGHTLCEGCLPKLIKTTQILYYFPCPVCGMQVQMMMPDHPLAGVPKNHALIDILREIEGAEENERFQRVVSQDFGGEESSNGVGQA